MFGLSPTILDELFITLYHPIRTKRRIYVMLEVWLLLFCVESIQITTPGHLYVIQVKTISPGSWFDLVIVAFLIHNWVLIIVLKTALEKGFMSQVFMPNASSPIMKYPIDFSLPGSGDVVDMPISSPSMVFFKSHWFQIWASEHQPCALIFT